MPMVKKLNFVVALFSIIDIIVTVTIVGKCFRQKLTLLLRTTHCKNFRILALEKKKLD